MYYSLLDKNEDGSWWYHRVTFTDRKRAETYFKEWTRKEKMILEHEATLPKETLWSYDLKHFHNISGELICTLK